MRTDQRYTPKCDITCYLHLFQKLFSHQILTCFHNEYPVSYVDTMLTYLCLDIAERLKEKNLMQLKNSSIVSYKQGIPYFVKSGLLFNLFSPFEIALGYQLNVYAPFVFSFFRILSVIVTLTSAY